MKTTLRLCIVGPECVEAEVMKDFDEIIPCFPGMLVEDSALHRDLFLEVNSVMFCTREPYLLVQLKHHKLQNQDRAKKEVQVFLTHGWQTYGPSIDGMPKPNPC